MCEYWMALRVGSSMVTILHQAPSPPSPSQLGARHVLALLYTHAYLLKTVRQKDTTQQRFPRGVEGHPADASMDCTISL